MSKHLEIPAYAGMTVTKEGRRKIEIVREIKDAKKHDTTKVNTTIQSIRHSCERRNLYIEKK